MEKLSRLDRGLLYFSYLLRGAILVALGTALWEQRWLFAFGVAVIFLLTFIPAFIERSWKLNLPLEFELVIVLFVYGTLFLGEVHSYYTRFWWWDSVLHAGSAIILGFVGFLVLYLLDQEGKIKTKPIWIAVFGFSFALAIGALWEIFEFVMDSSFGLNMQKSGLVDTMWDLIVDALGALFVSVLGWLYLKGSGTPIFKSLLKDFLKENKHLVKGK